jgi:hypothetical protein
MTQTTTRKSKKRVPAVVVSDHKIDICFGAHCRDKRPVATTLTMTELAARFSTPDAARGTLPLAEYLALDKKVKEQKAIRDAEKNGEYFIPAVFKHAGTRSGTDVKSVSAFTGDIDTGTVTRAEIEAKLRGLQYIAYSSYSHQASDPRWRFIVPYATPITDAEHRKVYAFFQGQFDDQLDDRSDTTNQIWYTPACPPDAVAQFEFFVGQGDVLDTDQIPEAAVPAPTKPAPSTPSGQTDLGSRSLSVHDLERLTSAMKVIPADDRQVWIKVGVALARDVGNAAGLDLWLEWSKKSEKFDHDDAVATWESFDTSDRDGKVTLGTVFHLAKSAGWVDTQPKVPDFVAELNRDHFVALDGGKNWVCREDVDPELGRAYLNRIVPSAFRMFYANQKVPVHMGGMVVMRGKADAWFEEPGRRSYRAICFMPGKPAPLGHYNLWHGFGVPPRQGDWGLLRRHIVDVICNSDTACAEYPACRGTSPLA